MAAPVSEHQLLCSIWSVCRRAHHCLLNDLGYITISVSRHWVLNKSSLLYVFIIGYFLQAGWLRKKYSPLKSMLGGLKSHLNDFHQENARECCMCGIQELSYQSLLLWSIFGGGGGHPWPPSDSLPYFALRCSLSRDGHFLRLLFL